MTCAKLLLKKSTNQQKLSIFLTFMPEKVFPSTHSVRYRLCFNSLGLSKWLLEKKPWSHYTGEQSKLFFKNELALPIKTTKPAQILPLSSRLMSNKGRFVHKILSGRAPMYLSTKLFINQSSRNSSRKLNVPIPRIDLFKSSLVYSGPVLWNSLPSKLRLPVSPSVFKKNLTLHMLSLLGVTWNHDHR